MYDLEKYLKKIDDVIQKGPYSDNWHSLSVIFFDQPLGLSRSESQAL